MRYAAMQVLTWGTIAGAIGSALLLASLEGPAHNGLGPSLDPSGLIQRAPPQAGPQRGSEALPPSASASEPAASAGRH